MQPYFKCLLILVQTNSYTLVYKMKASTSQCNHPSHASYYYFRRTVTRLYVKLVVDGDIVDASVSTDLQIDTKKLLTFTAKNNLTLEFEDVDTDNVDLSLKRRDFGISLVTSQSILKADRKKVVKFVRTEFAKSMSFFLSFLLFLIFYFLF